MGTLFSLPPLLLMSPLLHAGNDGRDVHAARQAKIGPKTLIPLSPSSPRHENTSASSTPLAVPFPSSLTTACLVREIPATVKNTTAAEASQALLVSAATNDAEECSKLIMEHTADPIALSALPWESGQSTAVHVAAARGSLDALSAMLACANSRPIPLDSEGRTAALLAMQNAPETAAGVVRLLLLHNTAAKGDSTALLEQLDRHFRGTDMDQKTAAAVFSVLDKGIQRWQVGTHALRSTKLPPLLLEEASAAWWEVVRAAHLCHEGRAHPRDHGGEWLARLGCLPAPLVQHVLAHAWVPDAPQSLELSWPAQVPQGLRLIKRAETAVPMSQAAVLKHRGYWQQAARSMQPTVRTPHPPAGSRSIGAGRRPPLQCKPLGKLPHHSEAIGQEWRRSAPIPAIKSAAIKLREAGEDYAAALRDQSLTAAELTPLKDDFEAHKRGKFEELASALTIIL